MSTVSAASNTQATSQQDKRIVPVCEFVAAYIKKHHDWDEIVESV